MVISFDEIESAFEFVSMEQQFMHYAYINKETGETFYSSEYGDLDELPEDVDDSEEYIAIPHKNELDLGRALVMEFISEMDKAFGAADIIVSRAGAGTISELCLVGKPVILVPSPNVAEDHQTRNAEALVSRRAAKMVPDNLAVEHLVDKMLKLVNDLEQREELSRNIKKMALPDSAEHIANEVLNILRA